MRLAAAVLVALLALPAAALASDRFSDARGDAGSGPDITAVALSHTGDVLRIAVDFAREPPLAFDEAAGYTDMLLVGIHTDDDLSRDDVEFATGVHGVDLEEAMVVGGPPRWRRVGTAAVTVTGTTVTLEVERALLGDPDAVAVEVAAGRERSQDSDAAGDGDTAPPSGPYRYALTDGGEPAWLWPAVGGGLAVLGLTALVALALRRDTRRRPLRPAH